MGFLCFFLWRFYSRFFLMLLVPQLYAVSMLPTASGPYVLDFFFMADWSRENSRDPRNYDGVRDAQPDRGRVSVFWSLFVGVGVGVDVRVGSRSCSCLIVRGSSGHRPTRKKLIAVEYERKINLNSHGDADFLFSLGFFIFFIFFATRVEA